ncbi:hypothetical protein ACFYUV_38210 [Nonomuraea sp. NPDC003560]|uniref:hypothetical protein n=1 Tax=Nonomuraea sp. NPDC003560 TaxID=3364341 RepID=UPI00367E96DC
MSDLEAPAAPARVMVAIEFVAGGRHQAVCRTEPCPAALGGESWRGTATAIPAWARAEVDEHRRWHRYLTTVDQTAAQRPTRRQRG